MSLIQNRITVSEIAFGKRLSDSIFQNKPVYSGIMRGKLPAKRKRLYAKA